MALQLSFKTPTSQTTFAHTITQGMAELLWPTRCVSCEAPGSLLCPECQKSLRRIAQHDRCLNCGAPFGWLVCCACDETWPELDGVVCACNYKGPGARIVKTLKDEHELNLVPFMAASLAVAYDEACLWQEAQDSISGVDAPQDRVFFSAEAFDACVFVPATTEAHLRRGFDHMALVGHAFSQLVDIPLERCLRRRSREDQRALGKRARRDNLQGSVEVVRDVLGLRLLLLDDVVTTGASMRECARALKARGAARVSGLAFARVW